MKLLRWCPWYDEARHAKIEQELAERELDIVDMAARLARLEAEVGIYKPLFVSDNEAAT